MEALRQSIEKEKRSVMPVMDFDKIDAASVETSKNKSNQIKPDDHIPVKVKNMN